MIASESGYGVFGSSLLNIVFFRHMRSLTNVCGHSRTERDGGRECPPNSRSMPPQEVSYVWKIAQFQPIFFLTCAKLPRHVVRRCVCTGVCRKRWTGVSNGMAKLNALAVKSLNKPGLHGDGAACICRCGHHTQRVGFIAIGWRDEATLWGSVAPNTCHWLRHVRSQLTCVGWQGRGSTRSGIARSSGPKLPRRLDRTPSRRSIAISRTVDS
jgi:hypothetical protein